jgi:hypothetical protein
MVAVFHASFVTHRVGHRRSHGRDREGCQLAGSSGERSSRLVSLLVPVEYSRIIITWAAIASRCSFGATPTNYRENGLYVAFQNS